MTNNNLTCLLHQHFRIVYISPLNEFNIPNYALPSTWCVSVNSTFRKSSSTLICIVTPKMENSTLAYNKALYSIPEAVDVDNASGWIEQPLCEGIAEVLHCRCASQYIQNSKWHSRMPYACLCMYELCMRVYSWNTHLIPRCWLACMPGQKICYMCVLYVGSNVDNNQPVTCKKEDGTKGIRMHRYGRVSRITNSCKRTGNMRAHLFEMRNITQHPSMHASIQSHSTCTYIYTYIHIHTHT